MESREYMGIWWIEGNPDSRLIGNLEYQPTSGIRLELIDDFVDYMPSSGRAVEEFEKILGITENGDSVTLLECTRDSGTISSSSFTGVRSSEYQARFLIEGFPFERMNPGLHSMEMSFYGIDKWAAMTNPRPGDEFLSDPYNVDQLSIVVDLPDVLSAWRDGINIELGINPTMDTQFHDRGEIHVQHEFRVKPRRTQVPFYYYLDHINNLNQFIALGLGHPTDPRYIKGKVRTPDGELHDVDIFYPLQGDIDNDISVHPLRMLFRPSDIADNYEYVINQWYNRVEEIDEIYRMYFGTLFHGSMYPENRLMSLCHGLESYHRKRFQDTYISPTDYDDVYDDFMDLLKGDPSNIYSSLGSSADNLRNKHDLPNPFVQSMKDGTIKHANKKSLRRRLKEVVEAVEPLLEDLPYSMVGKKYETAADTRNYFAHRTAELKRKAASGPKLIELIWGVQQLIEACLLLEIGIHPDQIRERLNNRYKNRWVS